LTKEDAKVADELRLFRLFLEKLEWASSEELISPRRPPEPDVVYSGNSETVAFEIGRVIERSLARAGKNKETGSQYQRLSSNCETVLLSKIGKASSYRSDFPIELILFSGGALEPDDSIIQRLKGLAESVDHVGFRRIWYTGEQGVYLIFP